MRKIGINKRPALLADEQGAALLMVLIIITILTTMVVSFTDTTQKNLNVAQYYKDKLHAYLAAQSGLETAITAINQVLILSPPVHGANTAFHWESEDYQTYLQLLSATPIGESAFIEEALPTYTQAGIIDQAAMTRKCFVVDENSRLSLFYLVGARHGTANEETEAVTFYRLVALFQHLLPDDEVDPETLVRYLVDWMDTENNPYNSELNTDQAEDYCPQDNLPYLAKNGLLDSADEIAHICGFRHRDPQVIARLTRYLTAYELNTNINLASRPVILALLSEAGSPSAEDDANEIYNELHNTAAGNQPQLIRTAIRNELQARSASGAGLENSVDDHVGVLSNYFRLGAYGVVYDPDTGKERARSLVVAIYHNAAAGGGPNPGNQLRKVYYRED